MKKASKILSLIIGLAICFASFCTPALAVSKTPEEEALYLQDLIAEVDQFVYINESNMYALSSLPARYSDLYSEMKESIDSTNALIQRITPLGKITFNKDDKSFSSEFLADPDGYGIYKTYWWGNRVKASSEDCQKIVKGFEQIKEFTSFSKYLEDFMDNLKTISLNGFGAEFDQCIFNVSSSDVNWYFMTHTLKPCK